MSEWIENDGLGPYDHNLKVDIRHRDGHKRYYRNAELYDWKLIGMESDIISYRIVEKSSETEHTDDNVNTPSHYATGNLECIDAIREMLTKEQFKGMLAGNVMKYIWRRDYKGKPLEDSRKAKWYLNRLIEEYENDNGN